MGSLQHLDAGLCSVVTFGPFFGGVRVSRFKLGDSCVPCNPGSCQVSRRAAARMAARMRPLDAHKRGAVCTKPEPRTESPNECSAGPN